MDNTQANQVALGVDFGDVIIQLQPTAGISFYDHTYLSCPQLPGAMAALTKLRKKFLEKIYIISKCAPYEEIKILNWLEARSFFAITGIHKNHVIFCRQREEKAVIAQQINLTHFIDDKIDVLQHMNTVTHLYLMQNYGSINNTRILPVASWDQAVTLITQS